MIPVLFPANAADYDSNGIGPLADATSCSVTEELNGAYQLKMTLPRSSPRLAEIAVNMQILAAPNPFDQTQPFRISRINKSLRGEIEITAPHLAYDLRKNPLVEWSGTEMVARDAIRNINFGQQATENKFNFTTTITSTLPKPMAPTPPLYIWDLLGNGENTLVGAYSGELKFDRREVQLLSRRGANRGYEIEYGTNMTELTYEADGENWFTAALPFWKNGSTLVVGAVATRHDYRPANKERVELLDLSNEFSSKPTVASLNSYANAYVYDSKNYNAAEIRVKATAVPPGSRGLKTLEEVQLGDTIRVKHEGLNVNVSARVVQTVYDVLRDRYTSFDVEGRVYGVATTIAKIGKQVKTGRVVY